MAAAAVPPGLADRYLTFRLGEGSYGVPVSEVREIIRLLPITPLPQAPAAVRGVVNLRDRIITVVDLRQRFGLGQVEAGPRTCIVVVDVAVAGTPRLTGLLVDDVEEVVEIPAAQIAEAPALCGQIGAHGLLGLARLKDGVKTLLDLGRVLGAGATGRLAA